MPLPQRVQEGAKKAAELVLAARAEKGKPAAQPVVAAPAPAPAPAAPAAKPETVEELKLKLEASEKARVALEQKQRTEDGRVAAEAARRKEAEEAAAAERKKREEAEAAFKKKIAEGGVTSLSDAERKLAGEDLVRVMAKTAAEVAAETVERALAPLTARVDYFAKMTRDAYEATLDSIQDFEKVNISPEFLTWLEQVDPATKRTRRSLLNAADAALQGFRVVEIFRAFEEKREIGARAAPVVVNPLEQRLEPARAEGGPEQPNLREEGRIWTRGEIARFYRDRREGKWKTTEELAEARAIEVEIFNAQQAGRVR